MAQRKRTKEPERIPPCAAMMGCLCAGHANGDDADMPCNTEERAPSPRKLIEQLTNIRNQLANIKQSDCAQTEPGESYAVTRMLDSIMENAAYVRAIAEGASDTKRHALLRKVRKALGYA